MDNDLLEYFALLFKQKFPVTLVTKPKVKLQTTYHKQ